MPLVPARVRPLFYNLGGPWWRCKVFEALGAQRPEFDALLAERYAFVEALSQWDALYRRRAD